MKNIDQQAGNVFELLMSTLLGIWDAFIAHTPFIIAGILTIFFTWLLVRVLKKSISKILNKNNLRPSLQSLLIRLIVVAIWSGGLLLAAMFWFPGLTPTTALGGLGLLSIAIGLAFQDIFENLFAGILLLLRFPFETGDYIECEGILGRVEDVNIRMTSLRLVTDELILVPNSLLFKNPVTVLTDCDLRRIEITAGIAYNEKIKAVSVITDAVSSCPTVSHDKDIQVFPKAFGSSSIDIEVAWWTKPTPLDVRRSRAEVISAIKSALDEAGIEIPFPYRTLTFKQPLSLLNSGRPNLTADSE